MTARVLVVHHTVSPAGDLLLEAAREGLAVEDLGDVTADVRPALSATAADLLAADGVVLITPANIGYMSGALKHFFDTVYYPCKDATDGLPYAAVVHGNQDLSGAVRSITSIARGMGWVPVANPVEVFGAVEKGDREAVWEVAATVGATASADD
ncbi:NAD(P)H-dependent oxidoreductase [Janibacter sp. GXQ6167]|uniref:NAD(P)H-dependent oxidoreductase n=1 Tax=Janibacter sp. GXQ6167 TaxID=3240791 RepID=UPI00352464B3